jgi:hypothetical protein
MSGPRELEHSPGGLGTNSRNPERRGGSQNRRVARIVIMKCALGEGSQLPILRVGLDLAVPQLGVEPSEPIAKGLQLIQAETFHLPLYVLDSAHLKLHS